MPASAARADERLRPVPRVGADAGGDRCRWGPMPVGADADGAMFMVATDLAVQVPMGARWGWGSNYSFSLFAFTPNSDLSIQDHHLSIIRLVMRF